MRRTLVFTAVAFVALVLGIGSAFADSPNFHFAKATVGSDGALSVAFKETGLGNTAATEQVTLSVDTATATYQCFNNGGNHPKAGNKETVSTSLVTTGTFPVRNGQTTGVISTGPPPLTSGFACPNGQTLFLQDISYAGITVTGSAGDSLGATPDPVAAVGLHIPA